jgi:hypothetical protein
MRTLDNCNRIFLMHMRKAGGQTARRLLKNVCSRRRKTFKAVEGWPLDPFEIDDETFLVVNIRHPVDRICSLYNAEGRWRKLPRNWTTENMTAESAVPFDDWLLEKEPIQGPNAPPLWRATSNFYVKTLCGAGAKKRSRMELRQDAVTGSEYLRAVQFLQRVDLFLVCEWWRDDAFRRYVSTRLLGSGAGMIDIPHRNRTTQRQSLFDIRGHLTPAQRRGIEDANRWDLELYRYVCWQASKQAGMVLPPAAGITDSAVVNG